MTRTVLCAMLLAIVASRPVAAAQQDRGDGAAREQAFIETLRREDPASADRFIALRKAQEQAIAELRRKDAQVKILDFLDERDRRVIARLQDDIAQFNRALEDRRHSRDELKKLLGDP